MLYILSVLIVASGYYTFTFGVYLWKKQKNKLGGIGAILAGVSGTIIPIVILFIKS